MMKILVFREFDDFSRILAENNFEIINLPIIETKPLEDLSDLRTKLEKSENYGGIFLTSSKAAKVLAENFNQQISEFSGKIYILGKRSFEILKPLSKNVIYSENANTAREMLKKIPSEDLTNKRFLFVRGEKSLRVVPDFLAEFAEVDETIVYRTGKVRIQTDRINAVGESLKKGEITCACFFSPSASESFIEQFDAEILHRIKIATIGKTTAEYFETRNLTVDFVSSKSNAEKFAVELIEYLREEN